jgi:hypothetical protein
VIDAIIASIPAQPPTMNDEFWSQAN